MHSIALDSHKRYSQFEVLDSLGKTSFKGRIQHARGAIRDFCSQFSADTPVALETVGNLKRECLDHSLVLHKWHLKRLVSEYRVYFNEERPHQGIQQRIPNRPDGLPINRSGDIRSDSFLGGLHHGYSRVSSPLQVNFPGG
jgi:hypothetical protein